MSAGRMAYGGGPWPCVGRGARGHRPGGPLIECRRLPLKSEGERQAQEVAGVTAIRSACVSPGWGWGPRARLGTPEGKGGWPEAPLLQPRGREPGGGRACPAAACDCAIRLVAPARCKWGDAGVVRCAGGALLPGRRGGVSHVLPDLPLGPDPP